MFKSVISLCLMSFSLLFGNEPMMNPPAPPPRQDLFNPASAFSQLRLARAEKILSTLVPDPQSYYLILSARTAFGGEAVPPYVFSDKPTMIIYQGAISPNRSNEEVAFMMAHELGHLNLHHMQKFGEQMDKIFSGPPIGISGTTFAIFQQKFQEREADMFGLSVYTHAGYSPAFFEHTLRDLKFNPNIHFGSSRLFRTELSSLSFKDTHFKMQERFEYLVAEAKHMS